MINIKPGKQKINPKNDQKTWQKSYKKGYMLGMV